jgi:hypothetical protein
VYRLPVRDGSAAFVVRAALATKPPIRSSVSAVAMLFALVADLTILRPTVTLLFKGRKGTDADTA